MPTLQLLLLGALDVRCDDQPLPKPPTQKPQSLLAYLATRRQRSQSRERGWARDLDATVVELLDELGGTGTDSPDERAPSPQGIP